MEIKIEFNEEDYDEVWCALMDCTNILNVIGDGEPAEKYWKDIKRIEEEIERIARAIQKDFEYKSLTKDDILSIQADEEYAEAKEHWRDNDDKNK